MKNLIFKIFVLFVMIFSFSACFADDVQFSFAKAFGGLSADQGWGIKTDAVGNIYTTGGFSGTVNFGGGNITSNGSTDIFILKLDTDGNYVWAKQIGSTGADQGWPIAVDNSGNMYTAGFFTGTVDFNPGGVVTNLTTAGASSVYILKYNSLGDLLWAKGMIGSGTDKVRSISVDTSGNIYTIGMFSSVTDFDPGVGTANLTSAGGNDIFISKLDTDGNYVWVKQIGSTSSDSGWGIALDSNSNVYSTGIFNGTVDFDPGVGTANLTSAGGNDIFISKLDTDGNYIWAKRIGSNLADVGNSIIVDSSGNVYTTGYFNGTVDFDPAGGGHTLTSIGTNNIFISKLDTDGNYVFGKGLIGQTTDSGWNIQLDSNGNIYSTGQFSSTTDFDPGVGIQNLVSAGSADIYVSKLDINGDYLWAKRIGSTLSDIGQSLTVDSSGNVYTTGYFTGTVDFDPGVGTANLTSAGGNDIFILKLIPTDTTPDTFTFTDQTDVNISTEYTSNTITVADINNSSPISITSCTGTVCEYSINGGAYTSIVGTVVNGDTVTVHQTSSALHGIATDLVLDIGGVSDIFTITTVHNILTYTAGANGSITGISPQLVDDNADGTEVTAIPDHHYHFVDWSDGVLTASRTDINVTDNISVTANFANNIISSGSYINLSNGTKITNPVVTQLPTYTFSKTLKYRMTNNEVKELQKYLNTHNYPVATIGAGSPGNETNYFGLKTKSAVIKFQLANGLKGDGIVGVMTRGKVR